MTMTEHQTSMAQRPQPIQDSTHQMQKEQEHQVHYFLHKIHPIQQTRLAQATAEHQEGNIAHHMPQHQDLIQRIHSPKIQPPQQL